MDTQNVQLKIKKYEAEKQKLEQQIQQLNTELAVLDNKRKDIEQNYNNKIKDILTQLKFPNDTVSKFDITDDNIVSKLKTFCIKQIEKLEQEL